MPAPRRARTGRSSRPTEDQPDGGLYRFTPASYPDLSAGLLEVMVEGGGWAEVPDPAAIAAPTRRQAPGMRRFDGGEGIWFDSRSRTVTLDRRRLRARRTARVRLRVSGVEARRLRAARPLTLHVAASARGEDGVTRASERRVRLR